MKALNNYNIQAINKHLKSVFDMFGGQSQEYSKALQEVRSQLSENVLQQTARQGLEYNADNPEKPLQLSVGKKSKEILSNFETELKNIRQSEKATGSALQQAQKYIDELQLKGKEFNLQNIKQMAQSEYNFNNNSNEWYKSLTESDYLTDDEKQDVRNIYSEISHKYNDPEWKNENMGRLQELLNKHEYLKEMAIEQETEDNINAFGGEGFEINPTKLL